MNIRKGFTFLELLVVVLIIGIMAAASPVFAQYNTKIYTEQGGAKKVITSGGEMELLSGAILDIQAGAVFTNAAALTQSGVLTQTGNAYYGASNYKSTFTAASGAQAWTGVATFNGGLISTTAAFTGAVTHTAATVTVSTSVTSSQSFCLIGAVAALPASGYAKNCLAVLTSDNALYISTEAPAGDQSWVKVGAQ